MNILGEKDVSELKTGSELVYNLLPSKQNGVLPFTLSSCANSHRYYFNMLDEKLLHAVA